MSRLITASLVGAIDWFQVCPPTWRGKALIDLTNQLARKYAEERSPAAERGIKFEDAVYAIASHPKEVGSEHFKWFVQQCTGGQFQRKFRKLKTIDGDEYCLYAKVDVWFPTIVKDIKTTANFRGAEKYLESFQHKLYCYAADANEFAYLVAEFDDEVHSTIKAHHEVRYAVKDTFVLEQEVLDKVRRVMSFLEGDSQLMELYTRKFC